MAQWSTLAQPLGRSTKLLSPSGLSVTIMSNTLKIAIGVIVVIVLAVVLSSDNPKGLGSVFPTGEYQATSTAANNIFGAQTADVLIATGRGSLGTVVVLGADTGIINFYDATTTNDSLRTVSVATSTILITSLPASLVAGTYVFDAEFTVGLFMDLDTGTMPTTTITWRR